MLRMACPSPGCAEYRRHHDDPHTPRGAQMVEVPDDLSHPVFCSITCAVYAGVLDGKTGEVREREHWKIEWPPKDVTV